MYKELEKLINQLADLRLRYFNELTYEQDEDFDKAFEYLQKIEEDKCKEGD